MTYQNMNGYDLALFWADIIVVIIGSSASALLVWIIFTLNVWNDFNLLIIWMAALLFFHFAFLFSPALILSGSATATDTEVMLFNMIDALGGTCSFMVSAIMSYAVTYLMIRKSIFEIKKYKFVIICVVLLPNLIWLPLCLMGFAERYRHSEILPGFTHFELGYYISTLLRLVPVAFNIVCYIIDLIYMKKMFNPLQSNTVRSKRNESAIAKLVGRLKWYPLLQVLARLFPTWITLNASTQNYMSNSVKYSEPLDETTSYIFFLNLFNFIGQLVAPCGFLVVYLHMQRRKFDITAPRQSLVSPKYRIESSQGSADELPRTIERNYFSSTIKSTSLHTDLLQSQSPAINSSSSSNPASTPTFSNAMTGSLNESLSFEGSDYNPNIDYNSNSPRATDNLDG
jgi:hypothetical protein